MLDIGQRCNAIFFFRNIFRSFEKMLETRFRTKLHINSKFMKGIQDIYANMDEYERFAGEDFTSNFKFLNICFETLIMQRVQPPKRTKQNQ